MRKIDGDEALKKLAILRDTIDSLQCSKEKFSYFYGYKDGIDSSILEIKKMTEQIDEKSQIIHLMVTEKCLRNCEHCCNNQYDLNEIPYITQEEYENAHTILLTGGEPVEFTDPSDIAMRIKRKYPNIKNVYVYANAYELDYYFFKGGSTDGIDGFSISIKDKQDLDQFNKFLSRNKKLQNIKSNRVYYFDDLKPVKLKFFDYWHRDWQEKFAPAEDSIFRRFKEEDL